jgi:hypothetical protein
VVQHPLVHDALLILRAARAGHTPVVDEGLNAHKLIVPGLGDFGDRLYGML